ncbi:MAG: tyrosine-protein phosphatase [Clostridia bacterium]|nr:tyrosine-protein phosphatase [Clostridia bacterium]
MRVFANLDNYPIYFHCAMGRDRTGTLAFVIEALLGASETDLRMDFELSALSVKGCAGYAVINGYGDQRNAINNLYAYIKTFQGADLAEKTENYLLGIGITAKEIQTIRNLMLEEVK